MISYKPSGKPSHVRHLSIIYETHYRRLRTLRAVCKAGKMSWYFFRVKGDVKGLLSLGMIQKNGRHGQYEPTDLGREYVAAAYSLR